MRDERQTCFSVSRLTPLNTPPLGAGMFIDFAVVSRAEFIGP